MFEKLREKFKMGYDEKTEEATSVGEETEEKRPEVAMSGWFWIRIFLCLYVAWIGAGLFRDGLKPDKSVWYAVAGGAFVVIAIGIIVFDLHYYFKHKKEVEEGFDRENSKDIDGEDEFSEDSLEKIESDLDEIENDLGEMEDALEKMSEDSGVGNKNIKSFDSLSDIAKYSSDDD